MIDETTIATLHGKTVYGSDDGKIGKVEGVFLDDESNRPEWITVSTGWFGSNVSFVPIAAAEIRGDDVFVPYDKGFVKDAPSYAADQHLSAEEEGQLYAYYGMTYAGESTGTAGYDTARTSGYESAGTTGTTGTDDAMTRSEERLHVGTERVQAGRARLRKHVVTENVTQTVPVRKETVRLEREPVTGENMDQALSGPDLSEGEHEVTLTEERPVVTKETVPVERVRLAKDTQVTEETVSETVGREEIDADGVYPDETTDVRDRTRR